MSEFLNKALGSLASGAGSLATGALNTGGNILSTILTNKANKELAQYSFDQQKQMIAEQNAYNSPAQQMARYQDAGLNPNLIYGSGQASAGNQSQIAKYDAPTLQAPQVDFGNAVKLAMEQAMLKADLDLRHQQFENLKEQQFMIRAQRHGQDIENVWNAVLAGFDPGLVTQVGDADKVKDSLRMKRYSGELLNLSDLHEYRQAQKAYIGVQSQVQSLNAQQKQFYNDQIQPLMRDILDKKAKGLDLSNDLLSLQKAFYKADKFYNYGKGVLDEIVKFINPIGGLIGGAGSPGAGLGSYYGPFNPSTTW